MERQVASDMIILTKCPIFINLKLTEGNDDCDGEIVGLTVGEDVGDS